MHGAITMTDLDKPEIVASIASGSEMPGMRLIIDGIAQNFIDHIKADLE